MNSSVRIAKIITEWDMRERHRLRHKGMKMLAYGEVLVAFNYRRTMARVIDAVGAIHDYYIEAGAKFDIDTLQQMMQAGIKVDLRGAAKYKKIVRLAA